MDFGRLYEAVIARLPVTVNPISSDLGAFPPMAKVWRAASPGQSGYGMLRTNFAVRFVKTVFVVSWDAKSLIVPPKGAFFSSKVCPADT